MVRAAIWLPGLAVALGAAIATAHGLYEVAVAARVSAAIAWLYPLITDGLALVAYAATVNADERLTSTGPSAGRDPVHLESERPARVRGFKSLRFRQVSSMITDLLRRPRAG